EPRDNNLGKYRRPVSHPRMPTLEDAPVTCLLGCALHCYLTTVAVLRDLATVPFAPMSVPADIRTNPIGIKTLLSTSDPTNARANAVGLARMDPDNVGD